MSDPIALLDAAIYQRLGTVTYSWYSGTALTNGSVPVYNTEAPQHTPSPYIVFNLQSGVADYWFNGGEKESFDYAVRVLSQRSFAAQEANPIFSGVDAELNHATLTLTGFKSMRVDRAARIRYRDNLGYWNVGAVYRIDIIRE